MLPGGEAALFLASVQAARSFAERSIQLQNRDSPRNSEKVQSLVAKKFFEATHPDFIAIR
jgi:hypothetical protein